LAVTQSDALCAQIIELDDIHILATQIEDTDIKTLRATADHLKDKLGKAIIVLATVQDNKVSLIASVAPTLTAHIKAGELVNFVAQQVGGKGGGKAEMAQAGGTEPDKLPHALTSVVPWVKKMMHEKLSPTQK
jgi:alanyl-tRNA synthetase